MRSAIVPTQPQWLNLVETAALRHIQESLFVDDAEMAEILSRPGLVKRQRWLSRSLFTSRQSEGSPS